MTSKTTQALTLKPHPTTTQTKLMKSTLNQPTFFEYHASHIQLCVKDGLKKTGVSTKNALEKCSAITKLSHQSTHFAERLERINVLIPSPNKTRWNSQYDTLCKIVSMPTERLNQILKDFGKPELCLSGKDISILNEFVDVLAFFSEATVQAQAENSPSIRLVAPSLLSIYFDLVKQKEDCQHLSSPVEVLLISVKCRSGALLEVLSIPVEKSVKKNKRFYELYKDNIFLISSFLDSKFEPNWVLASPLSTENKISICENVKKLVSDAALSLHSKASVQKKQSSQQREASTNTSGATGNLKRKSIFGYMENNEKKQKTSIAISSNDIAEEILLYLKEDGTDSSLIFKKSSLYPMLSSLATKTLCVPSASTPVERVFPQSGFLIRPHRARMTR
ncbi:unnamed protein product [Didymodactylos carnosus]|uniref:HAT C-terminal dimerisation domain-containing protein n=1 Tax=Didymodactylos carnosus TaxID=1234261 RepID=A0A8S2PF90_9BILA|nr:unnamed protein product [Didymodactylos carnosus]CAF4046696.1 unnamed protein product [Didymodactylos carnosus]